MLEPPSGALLRLLRELRLCSSYDLRRCRGRVRRMAHDLPAFDSVWIDALVQLQRLTPFQARILESAQPAQLRVGPFVLVDRLGGGLTGCTYIARGIQQPELRALKLLSRAEDAPDDLPTRLDTFLNLARRCSHPGLVAPQAWQPVDTRFVLLSRYIPGKTLSELLVRRGRFPAQIVWDLGRQLLDALAAWHRLGLAHGDIRPANVRLLTSGQAVLVDAGVLPVLEPELTPHSQLAPERYDCIAPELIGTGQTAAAQSDLYALGCLLWQLLAGRPPFPGGDPLFKLAAHQTRKIRDVRDFAPDTPAPLAEMLLRLTAADLDRRPQSAGQVLQYWGLPRRAGQRRLARFTARFEQPLAPAGGWSRVPLVAVGVALFAVSGLAFSLSDQGARNQLLQVVPQLWSDLQARAGQIVLPGETHAESPDESTGETLLPLPQADPNGVIELTQSGAYRAESRKQVGDLVIRATPGMTAEIVVAEESLRLSGLNVTLENVTLRRTAKPGTQVGALVLVESLNLTVRNVRLLTHSLIPSEAGSQAPLSEWPQAIGWRVADLSVAGAGECIWENVLVRGYGVGLDIRSGVRKLAFNNVLRLGPGVLVHLAPPAATPVTLECDWQHVTCRGAGSVVRWDVRRQHPTGNQLVLRARGCVWDVLPNHGAVIEFIEPDSPEGWIATLNLDGDVCLKPAEALLLAQSTSVGNDWKALDDAQLQVEGLYTQEVRFVGPLSDRPAASVVKGDVPRLQALGEDPASRLATLPGIRSALLTPATSVTAASGAAPRN